MAINNNIHPMWYYFDNNKQQKSRTENLFFVLVIAIYLFPCRRILLLQAKLGFAASFFWPWFQTKDRLNILLITETHGQLLFGTTYSTWKRNGTCKEICTGTWRSY